TAFDPRTGRPLWTHATDKGSTIPSPVAGGELIFAPGSELQALKPGAGDTTPEVVWKSSKLNSSFASPSFYQRRVYALAGAGVNGAKPKDGALGWQQRVKGPFGASPVVAGGKMYVANEDGVVTVLELGDKPRVLAANEMEDALLATPAVAHGCLYLRS